MNLYSLLLMGLAIGIQSALSADDEQYNSDPNSKSSEKVMPVFSVKEQDKRTPRRQNPASRQAAFGKRLDNIDDKLEFYERRVRGRGSFKPPPGSVAAHLGKRNDADKGKRRKFGVPSSRLAYFGKRDDDKDAEIVNAATEEDIPSINALLEKLMNVYDLNGDGVISKDEFFVVHAFLMQFP